MGKDKSMENDRIQIENESMKRELKDKLSDILNLDEENGRFKQQLLSFENLTNQMKNTGLENDRLQQQILAYECHIEKLKEYESNIREQKKYNRSNAFRKRKHEE